MDTSRQNEKLSIGFLSVIDTISHDGYIAGLLITDLQGIPIEFRCTQPVKPSALQRILYGDSLENFIGVNLCGFSLLRSIQNKPSLLIVNKPYPIELRKSTDFPIAYLKRAGETIELLGFNESGKSERIDCSTSRFNPVIAFCHPDFGDDLALIKDIILKSFRFLDPLEPFARIGKAIEIIEKNPRT